MHVARRQDEKREISSVSSWRDYGRQMELDSEARQAVYEVFKSLQSTFHPGWL